MRAKPLGGPLGDGYSIPEKCPIRRSRKLSSFPLTPISHLLRAVLRGVDSPTLAVCPVWGLSPLTSGLQGICRRKPLAEIMNAQGLWVSFQQSMTAREQDRVLGPRYLHDNPSHVHPLRSLVTGITQFASENRQKENSGSKFRKTVGQIPSDSHEL